MCWVCVAGPHALLSCPHQDAHLVSSYKKNLFLKNLTAMPTQVQECWAKVQEMSNGREKQRMMAHMISSAYKNQDGALTMATGGEPVFKQMLEQWSLRSHMGMGGPC